MTDPLEIRRRRALYRAHHRGTKELDIMIGDFADAHVHALDEEALGSFERFLAVHDPMLQGWLFAEDGASGTEFADLVRDVRAFHGLATSAEKAGTTPHD